MVIIEELILLRARSKMLFKVLKYRSSRGRGMGPSNLNCCCFMLVSTVNKVNDGLQRSYDLASGELDIRIL